MNPTPPTSTGGRQVDRENIRKRDGGSLNEGQSSTEKGQSLQNYYSSQREMTSHSLIVLESLG